MAEASFVINVDVFGIQLAVYRKNKQRRRTLHALGVEPAEVNGAAYATAHRDMGPDG